MQIAVGLDHVHAARRVEGLAEANAFTADQGISRDPQGRLHVSKTADRIDGIGAREPHQRAGVAQDAE